MRRLSIVLLGLAVLLSGCQGSQKATVSDSGYAYFVSSLPTGVGQAIWSGGVIEVNATQEIWDLVIGAGAKPKALYNELTPYSALALGLAHRLGLVDADFGLPDKYTAKDAKLIDGWKGKISIVIEMNFKPDLEKKKELEKNLEQAFQAFRDFQPPADRVAVHITLDPDVTEATLTTSADGVEWALTVPAYGKFKPRKLKIPKAR